MKAHLALRQVNRVVQADWPVGGDVSVKCDN